MQFANSIDQIHSWNLAMQFANSCLKDVLGESWQSNLDLFLFIFEFWQFNLQIRWKFGISFGKIICLKIRPGKLAIEFATLMLKFHVASLAAQFATPFFF